MKTCRHCGDPVALRPDGVWVHRLTRGKHCNAGPVPRPRAAPHLDGAAASPA